MDVIGVLRLGFTHQHCFREPVNNLLNLVFIDVIKHTSITNFVSGTRGMACSPIQCITTDCNWLARHFRSVIPLEFSAGKGSWDRVTWTAVRLNN